MNRLLALVLLTFVAVPRAGAQSVVSPRELDLIPIGLWLDDRGLGAAAAERLRAATGALGPRDHAAFDAARKEQILWLEAGMRRLVLNPMVALARAGGARITHRDPLAPLLEMLAPPALIATLAARPEVLEIYRPRASAPEIDTSMGTIRAREIPSLPGGNSGAGIAMGMCDMGNPSAANPNLPPIVNVTTAVVDGHATAIAGILASSDTTYRGVAPGLDRIYSGIGILDASAVLAAGANLLNVSLYDGSTNAALNPYDRLYDYLVRTTGRPIVKSAGNQGLGAGYVTTPGKGWNVLAVGSFGDGGDSEWFNDLMAPSSSYGDPASGAPKPELAAPGSDIGTTTPFAPWVSSNVGSGTSYAAPHVAGTLALLMAADARLTAQPAALRAAVMASSWHNLEGASALSDLDGAGGLDARAALALVNKGSAALEFGLFTPASFNAAGEYTTTFHLEAANRARLVLAWMSQAASGAPPYSPDTLEAAFDLEARNPVTGAPEAFDTHPAAAFRILEWVPRSTGSYTIVVRRTRFQGASEPYAIALSQIFDASTAELKGASAGLGLGRQSALSCEDPYAGGRFAVLFVTASGTGWGGGIPLGDRTVPFVPDPLWQLAITPANGVFSGFLGTLSPGGAMAASVTLPPAPFLLGLPPLGFCFATFDARSPAGVLSISPPRSISIVP